MEHLQENKDNDKYSLYESEDKTGDAGTNTNAETKTYEGFVAQSFAQSLIKADGSTIVQIKYKRKITSLILNLDGGKTERTLEDGKDGNKLLKGKYGAKVEVKEPTKENHDFEKWEPQLPESFPIKNDTEHIYTAKWKKNAIQIHIIGGDERLTVTSPVDFPFRTGMTWADIKEKMKENVSLKSEWQGGDYELYDWRAEGDKGEEITDERIVEDGMKVYPRSNYTKFKWKQNEPTCLIGYTGGKPIGKIIIPAKTTEIDADGGFYACEELTAVDCRGCSELKKIPMYTFHGCIRAEVKLPTSITEIENRAFGEYNDFWCRKVLVPDDENYYDIERLVRWSGYPDDRIGKYEP